MTAQALADLLNEREYKQEMMTEEIEAAKASGLVVVYGYSDDTTIFHGAIEAEVHSVNDTEILVTADGIFEDCPCDCIHSRKAKAAASVIRALWCKGAYVWHYQTDIPHVTFEIIDNQPADNLKFCLGMVFSIKDLK